MDIKTIAATTLLFLASHLLGIINIATAHETNWSKADEMLKKEIQSKSYKLCFKVNKDNADHEYCSLYSKVNTTCVELTMNDTTTDMGVSEAFEVCTRYEW